MFSAVLNNRLTKFSDEFELITNAQASFRKGFSTNDNIFIFHALISIYFSFGKKNCFVHLLISKVLLTLCGGYDYGKRCKNPMYKEFFF